MTGKEREWIMAMLFFFYLGGGRTVVQFVKTGTMSHALF